MKDKLYGIDYNIYACGGIGTAKIMRIDSETVLFYTESEMLKALADLKKENMIGEIKVFITPICRMDYRI
jgi:hypothetical protein